MVQRQVLRTEGAGTLDVVVRGRVDRPGVRHDHARGRPSRRAPADALRPRRSFAHADGAGGARAHPHPAGFGPGRRPVAPERGCVAGRCHVVVQVRGSPRAGGRLRRGGPRGDEPVRGHPVTGAVAYTLACTAMPGPGGTTCLVTDHRLLPLSWTRDAYYQAAALLAAGGDPGIEITRRHLAWLWDVGRDRRGLWQRSRLVTGQPLDRVYRLTSSCTRCWSCWTSVRSRARGPRTTTGVPVCPRSGAPCHVTGRSSRARRTLPTTPPGCPTCCRTSCCSPGPPSGWPSTPRTSDCTDPGWSGNSTRCSTASMTRSPATARSVPSGPTPPTPPGSTSGTTTPTTCPRRWLRRGA